MKRLITLILILTFIVPTLAFSSSENNLKEDYIIRFKKGIKVTDAIRDTAQLNIKPVETIFKFEDITGSYKLPDDINDVESLIEYEKKQHQIYIDDTMPVLKEEKEGFTKAELKKEIGKLERMQNKIDKRHIDVIGLLVKADLNVVDNAKSIPIIKKVEKIENQIHFEESTDMKNREILSSSGNNWTPNWGKSKIDYSGYKPDRYTWQHFKWTYASRLAIYTDYCHGYEHETHLNNKPTDPGTFLNGAGFYAIRYRSTNLPYAYLDRPVGGSGNEPQWTYGTARGEKLVLNNLYNYYIRTVPGNDANDYAYIRGAAVKNSPCYCHSWWCQYEQYSKILLRQSSTNNWVKVPGYYYWSY